jgi:hypothetical protein
VAGIVSVGGGAVLVAVDRAAGFVSCEGIADVGAELGVVGGGIGQSARNAERWAGEDQTKQSGRVLRA